MDGARTYQFPIGCANFRRLPSPSISPHFYLLRFGGQVLSSSLNGRRLKRTFLLVVLHAHGPEDNGMSIPSLTASFHGGRRKEHVYCDFRNDAETKASRFRSSHRPADGACSGSGLSRNLPCPGVASGRLSTVAHPSYYLMKLILGHYVGQLICLKSTEQSMKLMRGYSPEK